MWGTLNKQGVNLSNTNLSLIYREYYSEMVCVKKCTHIHTHTYTHTHTHTHRTLLWV
jgi:hypothetical protein